MLDVWLFVQIVLLAATYAAARLASHNLRPHLQRQLDRLKVRARLVPLVAAAPPLLVSVIFVAMLWLATGVMQNVTWSASATAP